MNTTGTDPAHARHVLLAILSIGHVAQIDRRIEKFLRPNPTLIFTFVHNQNHRSIGRACQRLRMDTADCFTVFVCQLGGLLLCHVKPEVV